MIKTEKIDAIDSLRGIAALMVCIFHFTGGTLLPDKHIIKELSHYGHAGVHIFFIISGFVIPYSMYKAKYELKNIKNFLLRRTARIEPPYLVSIALLFAISYAATLVPSFKGAALQIDFINLILHIGYLNIFTDYPFYNIVYWTLAVEFQYYIIIALIFPLLIRKSALYLIILLCIWYSISFLVVDINFIFMHMPYFALGIFLFRNYVGIDTETSFYVFTIILLGLVFFVSRDKFYVIIPAFLIIKYFPQFKFWGSAFLGMISYSLYLIHGLIGGRVMNLGARLSTEIPAKLAFALVAIIISIVAAYVYYLLIEKPSLNLAKKINYKQDKEQATLDVE
jgi:peptidoglycan/LPS O-acetylase OafA/YrhL